MNKLWQTILAWLKNEKTEVEVTLDHILSDFHTMIDKLDVFHEKAKQKVSVLTDQQARIQAELTDLNAKRAKSALVKEKLVALVSFDG